jgi:predicted enzyme related to lactoylglutathione lyase
MIGNMNSFSKYRVLIFSENPDKLMKFYRDVLELKLESQLKLPNDYGYMFIVNGDWKLWIGKHSGVKGKAKEPFRHIFNLYVYSVNFWYNKIKNNKEVKIVCKPTETPFSKPDDRWFVSTFLDPENNCWQFMGKE